MRILLLLCTLLSTFAHAMVPHALRQLSRVNPAHLAGLQQVHVKHMFTDSAQKQHDSYNLHKRIDQQTLYLEALEKDCSQKRKVLYKSTLPILLRFGQGVCGGFTFGFSALTFLNVLLRHELTLNDPVSSLALPGVIVVAGAVSACDAVAKQQRHLAVHAQHLYNVRTARSKLKSEREKLIILHEKLKLVQEGSQT